MSNKVSSEVNQELLAACRAVLHCLNNDLPINEAVKYQVLDAILSANAIAEQERLTESYEPFILVDEAMERINSQMAYDLLRGITVAICMVMDKSEAEELIRQVNAQEIVSQYGHVMEYGKVIKRR